MIGVIFTPIFANKEQSYSWVHWKGCDYDCVREVNDLNSTCTRTVLEAKERQKSISKIIIIEQYTLTV